MRQKILKARGFITVLLAVLLALGLGLGAKFAPSFSAYAEEQGGNTSGEEIEPDKGEEEPYGDLYIRGWKYGNYDLLKNAIYMMLDGVERSSVQYTIFSDDNGAKGGFVSSNLTNFYTDDYGLIMGTLQIERLNRLGVGKYWLEAKVGTSTYRTTFNVTNGWKSEPKIIEWAYGEYNPEINRLTAEALDGEVSFTVSDGIYALEGLEAFNSVSDEGVSEKLSQLDAGKYYLQSESKDLLKVTEFTVRQLQNRWEVIPSVNGWSEGEFNAEENAIKGVSEQGKAVFTIYSISDKNMSKPLYTIKDGKLYNSNGDAVKMSWLNKLSADTYTLVAEVEGTVNYSALKDEIQFTVFENAAVHGGIIAATVVFGVIDVIAAGLCIFVIIYRRRKVEDQFHKMVSKELRRR